MGINWFDVVRFYYIDIYWYFGYLRVFEAEGIWLCIFLLSDAQPSRVARSIALSP